MTQVDRLLKARRSQRDAAADALAKARERLNELAEEQTQIYQNCRERLVKIINFMKRQKFLLLIIN